GGINGLPWMTYTPSLTGVTNYGSGSTRSGRYRVIGSMCFFAVHIQFGGTGLATGTSHWSLNLPVPAKSGMQQVVSMHVVSSATGLGEAIGDGKIEGTSSGVMRLYARAQTS